MNLVLVKPSALPLRSRSDRATDIGWVLVTSAIGGATLAASWPRHQPWLGILAAIAGTLACLSVCARRSRPLAVAVFTVSVLAFSPMAIAAAIIAMVNVAVCCRLRTYAILAGYALVLLAVDVGLSLEHVGYFSQHLNAQVVVVPALAIGLLGRVQQAKRESEQRRDVEQARGAERTRIAREMHDVLAHRISIVSLHAGALEFHPDAPPEDIARAAGVIRASAHAALGELREVINLLRDPADRGENDHRAASPRPQPTLMDLPQLVEESRQAGTRVSLDLRLDQPETVPLSTGRTVYRIVQEGLTNARKHALASVVEVAIKRDPSGVLAVSVLTGPPDSEPTDPQAWPAGAVTAVPGSGTGLIGLAERVELARGQLEHGPTRDGGYALRATLPPA